MTPTRRYRRLPGIKWNPVRKTTLWMADDHILSVNSLRFTEDYRRYYFKDIQAIVLRQTSGASAASKALNAVVTAALIAIIVWQRQNFALAIPATALLGGFLALRLRGPRCVCHVVTAVSRDKLPSLYRLKTAEKTLRILQPLIEQAQKQTAPMEQVT